MESIWCGVRSNRALETRSSLKHAYALIPLTHSRCTTAVAAASRNPGVFKTIRGFLLLPWVDENGTLYNVDLDTHQRTAPPCPLFSLPCRRGRRPRTRARTSPGVCRTRAARAGRSPGRTCHPGGPAPALPCLPVFNDEKTNAGCRCDPCGAPRNFWLHQGLKKGSLPRLHDNLHTVLGVRAVGFQVKGQRRGDPASQLHV